MATLTLTVAAGTDDATINDNPYTDSGAEFSVGGVGTSPLVNHGQGWRFTGVTLTSADTINSAILKLMKNGTAWSNQVNRWTFEDADNAATFSSGSPPGSRPIIASPVADTNDTNELDVTVYNFPRSGGNQTTLGARLASVLARGGWASGNAVVLVNNSDQDDSASATFARKSWLTYNSSVGSSEPQLVIDYTAAAGTTYQGTASATQAQTVAAEATVPIVATPRDLIATMFNSSQIDLAWDDRANNETRYEVQRSLDGSTGWTDIAGALAADSESHSDTGRTASTQYFYRVRAVRVS